jgi:hypothetical protein
MPSHSPAKVIAAMTALAFTLLPIHATPKSLLGS